MTQQATPAACLRDTILDVETHFLYQLFKRVATGSGPCSIFPEKGHPVAGSLGLHL